MIDAIERVPIRADADGVVRIAGTRVTLDTLISAFDAGATAEGIVQQYPAIRLADVSLVIAYYLRHVDDVRRYLVSGCSVMSAAFPVAGGSVTSTSSSHRREASSAGPTRREHRPATLR